MAPDSNWKSESGTGGEDRVTRLLQRVPGYRGYRDKEGRRDSDRLLRERIATAIGRQADRIDAVGRELADRRRLEDISAVTAFSQSVRHLADRVRTASYGYEPLFSDRSFDDKALEQLALFDESILDGVSELDAPIADLEKGLAEGTDLKTAARAGATTADAIGRQFDAREDIISTGEAVSEEGVLSVLNTPIPPQTHPAYALNNGDAVDVFGDDCIVDARVDVQAGERSFRLFRIATGPPDRWLYVPHDSAGGLADLRVASDSEDGFGPQLTSGAGKGEVSGIAGGSGRRPVQFTLFGDAPDGNKRVLHLDWGKEEQLFAGTALHSDDVVVYGATGNAAST